MFAKELTQAGHVRRFIITDSDAEGWELREEEDSAVVRRVRYTDWHRVERALAGIDMRVHDLEARGWRTP
jgi:predicted ATP-dependent endonuclease of OLD family